MPLDYVLAWLLPLFAGSGVWWLANGRDRCRGDVAASLGSGWLIGVILAALCARWIAREDTVHAFALAAPWLAGVGALAWIGVALRARRGSGAGLPVEQHDRPLWRVLWVLLLALVALRLAVLADEAALRPVFPWDAWSAWAVKPKSWMLLGHADAYVPMQEWLANPAAPTRTMMAWNYPELLAWIEVWFASGAGGWNEPLVDLAWCGALVAFGLALYGHARGFGLRPWVAMALLYALVSLPLIDAHVALAGYADLWIAVALGLAMVAWARWLAFGQRAQWLLGVGFALCLPAFKLEGAIWLLTFMAVVVFDLVPARRRWPGAGGLAVLVALGLLLGGLPLLGLGWVHVAWGEVEIPGVASYALGWHPVGGAMLASLFTLPNWHLLWYALPLLVALRWRALRGDHAAQRLGLLVLLQLAFLFLLFFLTSAATWAEDFTSVNRLILQVVPGVFVFATLLLRDARARSAHGLPRPSTTSPLRDRAG